MADGMAGGELYGKKVHLICGSHDVWICLAVFMEKFNLTVDEETCCKFKIRSGSYWSFYRPPNTSLSSTSLYIKSMYVKPFLRKFGISDFSEFEKWMKRHGETFYYANVRL